LVLGLISEIIASYSTLSTIGYVSNDTLNLKTARISNMDIRLIDPRVNTCQDKYISGDQYSIYQHTDFDPYFDLSTADITYTIIGAKQ
jgi:hypothetical protein